jgi:CRISPR-associated protein (TIGR02584 family)
VLFAVTGMTPAVLTETVWALAHETPPVLPHRIVVVTTTAGRDVLRRQLLDDSTAPAVWDGLRATLTMPLQAAKQAADGGAAPG